MFLNNKQQNVLIDLLIACTVFTTPLYQIRISLFHISISLLTITLVILCISLFIFHSKHILCTTTQAPLFALSLFFVISFVPSLLLFPHTHAFGVFIEWIALPVCTSVLLWTHFTTKKCRPLIILYSFLILSFAVSVLSLIFYAHGFVTYDHRLSAFFSSPNYLALFIVPFIFSNGALFFKTPHTFTKVICVLTSILCTITVFLTQSLSTFLALSVTTFITSFFCIKQKKIFLLIATTLIGFLCMFAYIKILNSNTTFERNSFTSRTMIWRTALFYIQQNPLFGYEIDSFQKHYLATQPLYDPYLEWAVPTEHNSILHFLISGGYFGLLSFCLLCTYTLFCGYTQYHNDKKPQTFLLCSSFLVILLCGLFDTPYWKNDLAYIFWLIILLVIFPPSQNRE